MRTRKDILQELFAPECPVTLKGERCVFLDDDLAHDLHVTKDGYSESTTYIEEKKLRKNIKEMRKLGMKLFVDNEAIDFRPEMMQDRAMENRETYEVTLTHLTAPQRYALQATAEAWGVPAWEDLPGEEEEEKRYVRFKGDRTGKFLLLKLTPSGAVKAYDEDTESVYSWNKGYWEYVDTEDEE